MRLKRHYSIVAHSPDVVELRYGTWNPVSFTLTDESGTGLLLRVLSRLDGRSSAKEIASAEGIPKSEVEALLDQLAELGLVEEQATHALDHYLDHIIPNLVPYESEGSETRPSVILFGDQAVSDEIGRILTSSDVRDQYDVLAADEALRNLLLQCSTSWLFDPLAFEEGVQPFAEWRERFVVVGNATVNPLELQAFNRISLHYRIPWIHAAVDGPFLLIGPTFIPFSSPCYECLEARILTNLREAASYQSYKRAWVDGRITGTVAPLDAVLQAMLASLTAFEVMNFMLTGASFTVGKMLSVYLPTMEFTFNEVLRLPGCPACSPVPERDGRELFFDVRTLLDDKH